MATVAESSDEAASGEWVNPLDSATRIGMAKDTPAGVDATIAALRDHALEAIRSGRSVRPMQADLMDTAHNLADRRELPADLQLQANLLAIAARVASLAMQLPEIAPPVLRLVTPPATARKAPRRGPSARPKLGIFRAD